MWHSVYVGPGSLYVNGQKVLQTDVSDNVVVSADINQNLISKTSGTGNIELNPSGGGQILLKGDTILSAGKSFRMSNSSAVPLTDGVAAGNITISGNAITASNLNGGISLTPNGTGGTYVTTGNFGIGTTSPSTKLSVAGDASITSNLTVLGQTTLTTASSSALTATTLYSTLANITNSSTTGLTATNLYTTTLSATGQTTLGLASSTGLTVSGNSYFLATTTITNLFGASLNSCNSSTEKLMWTNGTFYCGTDAGGAGGTITSLNGSSVASQTLATSSGNGLDIFVVSNTGTGVHTLSVAPTSGFSIPITASTTQWSSFYNSPISFFTPGSNILFSSTSTIAITPNPTFTTGTFSTLISGTSTLGNASATALTVNGQTVLATTTVSSLTSNSLSSAVLNVTSTTTTTGLIASIIHGVTSFFTTLTGGTITGRFNQHIRSNKNKKNL
jgi:hypothetical protein